MTSAFPTLPTRRPTLPTTTAPKPPSIYLRTSTSAAHSSVSSLNSLFNPSSATIAARAPADADAKSLILRAFVPHVAVHVSDDTNALAREKGFADFKDMLRPYGEEISGRVTVRDSQGISSSYDDFGMRFVALADVAAGGEKWETGLARAAAAAMAAGAGEGGGGGGGAGGGEGEKRKVWVGGSIEEVEELVGLHMDRELAGTGREFYMLYLRRLLSALPVAPHETFSHPVACVIAISSRNTTPIETLRNLYTSGSRVQLPAYVNTDYLRYYVLVHDEDRDDIKKSNSLFDQMKKHFGLHCHLLRLRSGGRAVISDDDAVIVPKPNWISAAEELASITSTDADYSDDQPALCLPDSDAAALTTMIREMAQVSIIPFMERCVATWNDQVASRRRGLSGRFLSMSKRYFGSSGSRTSTSASNYDPLSASYHPSTPEAQMRKLADYAFLLRDWRLANGVYDLLRTDFGNDKAWKYHAGAQEMTAISLILTGTGLTTKVRADQIYPLLDLAVYSYRSRCSSTYCALRALLVSVELLRLRGGGAADEAATWAIHARDMHANPGIGHALVTERVGACYSVREGVGTGAWGARRRKAAMWRMLAAGEWLAAGRGAVSRACLEGAVGVYEGTGFGGVRAFVEGVKRGSGFGGVLVDRRSVGGKAGRELLLELGEGGARVEDDFVEN
ncbi:uncharacterized protein LAJ45_05258 [Morchella importuna]|uniref:uncharacterized protein n=1 Tax=Morchella importuna TaxID=1174673 RepID=UPI001E8D85DF|nr:uncharacterized protein LAJ45_05258 [Morchella importuna]KAH8150562.1 hypothetical protein LAJ45_05258 [Morchella importuna]